MSQARVRRAFIRVVAGGGLAAWAARSVSAGDDEGTRRGASGASSPRTIRWEDLIPPDWKPQQAFRGIAARLMNLTDGSPEAAALMEKMREVWDQAPTHARVTGTAIRLPGFVVPLDMSRDARKEFLLVPYFGACIHTPPPPANQIVFVRLPAARSGLRSMDAVWVEGVLREQRDTTDMGISGYALDASRVEPYREPAGATGR